ncbi:hypothetical protein Tco_0819286 [Tanacetum coccineum]|uniref:Uncharacterized protein n=1 Tax=Tanacetum coccineum TaxID=301880 RepID=A0ABQ5A907_9ASTR
MELNELHMEFKKWEQILHENVLCLTRNKDHPNAALSYMINCFTNELPFNLAYFMVKRMERVKRNTGKGKRTHPPTDSSSSQSDDPSHIKSNLSPSSYIKELLQIENASGEFKQTNGDFQVHREDLVQFDEEVGQIVS